MASGMKGILWGLLFLITALIMIIIPTRLIWTWWAPLNEIVDPIESKPVYTWALLGVFGWIVTIVIFLIYVAATCRAFVQRKSEDLGISRGIKGFALVVSLSIIAFMIIWYLLFQQIAFFSWVPAA